MVMETTTTTRVDPSELLYSQLRKYQKTYVLIDRLALVKQDPMIETLAECDSVPLRDEIFDGMKEKSPFVVEVSIDKLTLVEGLLNKAIGEVGRSRVICAFLFAHDSLETVALHLSRQLNLRVNDTFNVYFRYFDPRVWPHIYRIFSSRQLVGLFGRLDAWFLIDERRRAQLFVKPPATESGPAKVSVKPECTIEQWHACEQIELINLVVNRLRLAGKSHVSRKEITNSLEKAAMMLSEYKDQVIFAACDIIYNKKFVDQPFVADMISLANGETIPLEDLLVQRLGLEPETLLLIG